MTGLRKATATPEQWAKHLEYHRLRRLADPEAHRAKMRAYRALPHVKEARRGYDQQSGNVKRRKAYHKVPEHKATAKDRYQERFQKDPDFRHRRNVYQRKLRTGFDHDLVLAMIKAQDNRCAICFVSFDERRMVCDHDHAAGKPRGLLCHHCNIIEGMLVHVGLDPVEFARRLVQYLNKA